MSIVPKGGRGRKAPYETTHKRIPVALSDEVDRLVAEYRNKILGGIAQDSNTSQSLDSSANFNGIRVEVTKEEAIAKALEIAKSEKKGKKHLLELIDFIYSETD